MFHHQSVVVTNLQAHSLASSPTILLSLFIVVSAQFDWHEQGARYWFLSWQPQPWYLCRIDVGSVTADNWATPIVDNLIGRNWMRNKSPVGRRRKPSLSTWLRNGVSPVKPTKLCHSSRSCLQPPATRRHILMKGDWTTPRKVSLNTYKVMGDCAI